MLTLRPSTPEDQPAVAALFDTVWNGDEGAALYHVGGRAPGVVAVEDGQLIGYASARSKALHPTHIYVGVHVHPAWRTKGVGAALWREVTASLSGSLKTALYDGDPAARQFLERRGLSVSVETRQPTLDPARLGQTAAARWKAEALALGYELLPMTELDSPGFRRSLGELHAQVYAHSHQHDPPDAAALAAVDFLDDDFNPAWLWLARKDGELTGVSSVLLTDDVARGELGYFGVSSAVAEDGVTLTLALTAAAIQSAGQAGVISIGAELDSADPNALALWHSLPWQPGRVWLTLISAQGR